MNSTGAPNSQPPTQPFGYAFFDTPDAIQESSDVPASGPNLLNHSEDNYLDSFLRGQQQQYLPTPNDPFQQNMQLQEQLQGPDMGQANYDWLMTDGQIPGFVHASATPKPPPSPPHNMIFQGMSNYDFANYGLGNDMLGSSHHDILSAASILNNTASSQSHNPRMMARPMGSAPGILESIEHLHTPNALPTASYLSQSIPHEADYGPRLPLGLETLNTAQSMSYDGPHTAPPRMEARIDERLYRFGSDNHFVDGNFVPQSEAETDQYVSNRLTTELHQLKPINRSNDATRQSSPVQQSGKKRSIGSLGQGSSEDDRGGDSKPLKRKRQDSEDGLYGSKSKATMRRASHNPRARRISSADTTSRRRRSSLTGSATKQSRENLTDEQKRSNHIQSEQKRRNLIKEGFERLNTVVPELRAGGLSKSQVLAEAGNFLEQLLNTNRASRERTKMQNGG